VRDGAEALAAGGEDGARAALDGAWLAIRPVARAAMIDAGGGRIQLLAPRPGGAAAAAARAGLENLARTLSIEWSRFGVRTVAITPGPQTVDDELSALAAYLASPAGDYFSGCVLALGGV
jgi:NAD(P)-dependent dehydrogenase (short-subunit alcohol dehydrogenase family)